MRTKPKVGVLTAQKKQREAVKIVSKDRCEVEYLTARGWERCPDRGAQAAHIYTRSKCGKARDRVEVVVWCCKNDHNVNSYDGRFGLRVPLDAAQLAWDVITDAAKDKPSTRALLGPRPEKGQPPYDETPS